ncbi:hypothetical protein [Streptomyces sp. SID13031]|uniref:hypothetical protein n=1 Tax=Streptomyces sp. SID13031 TaxID=2706046 RepID=UPI0013C84605|nr:hypothetical protein [Streptomyces sp. SID13031]NEA30492.1 hypothetical protein [Streptomyces sp. SID13031]
MREDVEFSYRLPLTYVRITGTRTDITDELVDGTVPAEYASVVTTEAGADPLTECRVSMSAEALTTQKSTWNLLTDGRLTGTDVTVTAEPLARWKTALEVGAAVVGAGALVATGPVGWGVLGGAGAAAIGAGIASSGSRNLFKSLQDEGRGTGAKPAPPGDADMDDWDVPKLYQKEEPEAAKTLANYRQALATGAAAHANAARAWAMAVDEQDYWEYRVRSLQRMLASATVGAEHAEAAYTKWKSARRTTMVTPFDERFRIDVLPDSQTLTSWAKAPGEVDVNSWTRLAKDLCVAVSVDLEDTVGDDGQNHQEPFEPRVSRGDVIHRRQPRPAVLTVWKLKLNEDQSYEPEKVDVRRLLVAYPGNEKVLSIESEDDTSGAVAAVFDESGALTKVTTDLTDPALQRAKDISALIPAVGTAAQSGRDLMKAFSPPTLVERAAEAKAARELGLTPSAPDPLETRKKELAEQQLQAQLKIAQQINSSTSVPVMVTITQPAAG